MCARVRALLPWGLLVVASLAAFWPMFANGFVWDDQVFIVRNPALRGLWPVSRFLQSHGSAAEGAIYPMTGQRPAMVFSLAVDYALWKLNPFGYHMTNFILHLFCVFGVAWLALTLSRSHSVAVLSGALFALHPGHAEGVIAFLGRSDLLATLFVLLGFWGYVQHRNAEGWSRPLWYLGSLSSFLVACFSKESGLVLLGILLVYDWLTVEDEKSKVQNRKSKIRKVLPYILAGLLYWVYRGRILGGQAAGSTWWGGSPDKNFLMIFEVYSRYLGLFFFPRSLSPLHQVPVPTGLWDGRVLWGAASLLGSLLATAWALRKYPRIGLLASWFLIGLLPVANLIPIPGAMILAERWLYLPSVGLCALGGWGAWTLFLKARGWVRGTWIGLVSAIVVLFGIRTFLWSPMWRTQESVARTIVAASPGAAAGYNNLGNALLTKGRVAEALALFQQAHRLDPGDLKARHNMSRALEGMGDSAGAERGYREVLQRDSRFAPSRVALGSLFLRQGRVSESETEFRTSLAFDPDLAEGHHGLGNALDVQGRFPEAEEEFRTALRLRPDFPDAHYNLGNGLLSQGRPAEAEAEFREAIRLQPDLSLAYYNLALSLQDQGRLEEAASAYQRYIAANSQAPDRGEVEQRIYQLRQRK